MRSEDGLVIDHETADRIAVAAIRSYCEYLQDHNVELELKMKAGTITDGQAADFAHNVRYLEAARIVLKDFGESLF